MSGGAGQIKISKEFVIIRGEYFTVSNGFISKAHGEVRLPRADLLAAELVKCRSKKFLYAMLVPTAIFAFTQSLEGFISVAATTAIAAIVCALGVAYFFSTRQFIEITSMRGTYRVAVERGDSEIEAIVAELHRV